jgi:hypothetical protein
MLSFEEYLKQNKVLKREKDAALKDSLVHDSKDRISQLDIAGIKPKFRFEQAYDAVRELTDAFLARDGYKTYSHEAALSYLKKLGLVNDTQLERLDTCRKKRHDSKYYGKSFEDAEYEDLTAFLRQIVNLLEKKI